MSIRPIKTHHTFEVISDQIRDEARYLLSITPPDPDAAKHRAELVAAFGLSHRTAS